MKPLVDRRNLLLGSAALAGAAVSTSAETPLACNLKALTNEERRIHRERTERLFTAAKSKPLDNGYSIALPAGTWLDAAAWVELERKCCPFLRFQLESAAESGGVILNLTGRPGVKEFLEVELRLKP